MEIKLIPDQDDMSGFLAASLEVNFHHDAIRQKAAELSCLGQSQEERIKAAFEFVRDEIPHSYDIRDCRVSRNALEVLEFRTGICYAKSMLLAALLRSMQIPCGFCYQKLTLGDTPDSGYCIHALNAVYLAGHHCWRRLDARGNTNGRNAQFFVDREALAFPVRPELAELDYPYICAFPHPATIQCLHENENALEMIEHHLPTDLTFPLQNAKL